MSVLYTTPISETQRRIESENENINSAISQLQRDLSAEKEIRTDSVSRLNDAVAGLNDAVENSKNQSNNAVDAAKSELNQKIDSNVSRIDSNVNKLTTDLTTETGRAKEAEAALNTSLTQKIEQEQTDRAAADVIVAQGAASLVQQEIDERKAAIGTLNTNLTNEINARRQAEESIKQTIQSNVANLAPKTSPTFDGTVKVPEVKSNSEPLQAANVGYVNELFDNLNGKLVTFTKATSTADGKAGLVPAQGKTSKKQILTSDGWANMDAAGMTLVLPTQNGSLTYNRNSQSPTWNNYDPNKIKIEFTAQIDAGTYTAKATPLGLYVWSDTETQTTRDIQWKIDPLLLPKPAASVKQFTFNNANQGITVSNYDSTYMTQSGTVSARNANSYEATYTLKNTNNTKWSDGSTDAVKIAWNIAVLKLPKPAVTGDIEFDYDKETHGITVLNYDANYMTQGGTISSADAGEYNVTFTLKETSNVHWSDDSYGVVTLPEGGKWKIVVRELPKPSIAVDSFDFTYTDSKNGIGDVKSIVINNLDEKFMTVTGTQTASDAGVYSITFTLKDEKYSWEDKSKTPITKSWRINPKKVAVPTLSASSTTYTGAFIYLQMEGYGQNFLQGAASGSKNFAWTTDLSAGMTAVKDNTTQAPLSVYVLNAGEYSFTITPNKNHCWTDGTADPKLYSFKVNKNILNAPTMTGGGDFKGSAYSVSFTGFDSSKMNKSGDESAVNAGNYRVVVSLKNPEDYQWSTTGNSDDLIFTWQINRLELTSDQCNLYQTAPFVFNGSAYTFTPENFNSEYFTIVEGNVATTAGTYYAVVKVNDNYLFNGKNTGTVTIPWQIEKFGAVVKPSAAQTEFFFTNKKISLNVADVNTAKVKKISGDTEATACGAYSVTYALIDTENNTWADGTTLPVTINWTIEMYTVAKPVWQTSAFTYDGNEQSPSFTAAFDSTRINVSGKISAVDAGQYSVVCSLKDKILTTWSDGSVNDITMPLWIINRKKLTATQSNLKQSGALTYDGTEKILAITNFNSTYHTVSGQTKAIEAGNYEATVSLNKNFAWSTGSTADKKVNWTVNRLQLTRPTVKSATDFVFDNTQHSLEFNTYNTTHITITGTTSAVDADNYSCTASLKNTVSTYWANATTDTETLPISYFWSVSKTEIAEPSLTTLTLEYSLTGNVSPTFSGFDSDTMVASGALDNGGKTGTFTVTVALKDKTLNIWKTSKSAADIKLTYQVKPVIIKSFSLYHLTPSEYYIYSGSDYRIGAKLTYGNADTLLKIQEATNDGGKLVKSATGAFVAVDVGTYSATITLTDAAQWWDASSPGGSKTLSWEITPKGIPTPYVSEENILTYNGTTSTNGTAQNVQLVLFDAEKMTLGGQTSAVDEGVYIVTVTPKKNYCWYNKSQSAVALYWTIYPKPIASNLSNIVVTHPNSKGFTFTGSPITFTIKNSSKTFHTFDSSRPNTTNDSGNLTFSKTYIDEIAVYTCKNFCFADGAVKKVLKIRWATAYVPATAKDQPVVYLTNHSNLPAGSTQSPTINGLNETFCSIRAGSVTSANKEGFYVITVDLKTVYSNGDGTTCDITNANVLKWRVPDPNYVYTYTAVYPNECSSYCLAWGIGKYVSEKALSIRAYERYENIVSSEDGRELPRGFKIPGVTSSAILNECVLRTDYTAAAGKKGTFYAEYKPNTEIFRWAAARTVEGLSETIRIKWAVTTEDDAYTEVSTIHIPDIEYDPNVDYTYDGTYKEVAVSEYDGTLVKVSGTLQAKNAGTYRATVGLVSNRMIWADTASRDSKYIDWKIDPQVLSVQNSTLRQKIPLFYDGTQKTVTLTNYSATYHILSGQKSAIECGDYIVTVTCSSNYVFSDKTTSVDVPWSIIKSFIVKPTLSGNSFAYLAGKNPVTVNGFDENYMTATYKRGTTVVSDGGFSIGSYTVTFALKDKGNNTWMDGSTNDVVLNFNVTKRLLTKPAATTNSFVFSGSAIAIGGYLSNYDSDYMTLGGQASATNAGNFIATLSLKDTSNLAWADNTTAAVNVAWTITRQPLSSKLSRPTAWLNTEYTGSTKSVTLSNFDENVHTLGGQTSAVNVGTYIATVTPKANYCWEDGTFDAKELEWHIIRQPVHPPVFTGSSTQNYTGSDIDIWNALSVVIRNYCNDNVVKITGTRTAKNCGNYTITFKLVDPANYKWRDASGSLDDKSLDWSIVADDFNKPTISGTLTYNGNAQSPAVENFVADFMEKSSQTSMTDAGTYTIVIKLKDKVNNKWADGSTADVSLTWTINRKSAGVSSATNPVYGTLTYNGNEQNFVSTSHKPDFFTYTGTTKAKNAGNYTVIMTPKPNYCWSDGSFAAKSYTWTINKANPNLRLSKTSITINDSVDWSKWLGSRRDSINMFSKLFTVTYSGDGKLANGGSNSYNVARNFPTGVNSIDANDPSDIAVVGNGKVDLIYNLSETDNYTSATATVSVTVNLSLNAMPWEFIKQAAHNGNEFFFSIGDTKTISGNVKATLIGINHNSDIEGLRSYHFAVFNTGLTGKMNDTATNTGGWKNSKMRTYLNDTYLKSLPADLQAVIKADTKYSNDGNSAVSTSDKCWLLNEYETNGSGSLAGNNYSAWYEYFRAGNFLPPNCWLRSASAIDSSTFYARDATQTNLLTRKAANESLTCVPCFVVGR